MDRPKSGLLPNLIPILDATAAAAGKLRDQAIAAVSAKVAPGGKIDGEALEREQHIAHGLAWIATYVEALRQVAAYAQRMQGRGPLRRHRGAALRRSALPNMPRSFLAA